VKNFSDVEVKLFSFSIANAKRMCHPLEKTTPSHDTTETTRPPCAITCPDGSELDAENCVCKAVSICGLSCPQGSELDVINCECIPTDTSPTPKQCIEKPCKRGYQFFAEPICDCMLTCDYIEECPAGEKWDFIECGCVSYDRFRESDSFSSFDFTGECLPSNNM
jgi:hypothetical protein